MSPLILSHMSAYYTSLACNDTFPGLALSPTASRQIPVAIQHRAQREDTVIPGILTMIRPAEGMASCWRWGMTPSRLKHLLICHRREA